MTLSSVPNNSSGPGRLATGMIIIRILILLVLIVGLITLISHGVEPDVALAAIAGLATIAQKLFRAVTPDRA